MPIEVPDQGYIDLTPARGSRIQPADTYARAPVPSPDPGIADFVSGLNSLGANLMHIGAQQTAKQEQMDLQHIDAFKQAVLSEFKAGVPVSDQVNQNPLTMQKSLIVRSKIAESIGYDNAIPWVQAKTLELMKNPELRNDPAGLNAAINSIRSEAAKVYGNDFATSSGFLKAVDEHLSRFQGQEFEKTKADWSELIGKQYDRSVAGAVGNAVQQGFSYKAVGDTSSVPLFAAAAKLGGKSGEHITNVSAPLAGSVEKMLEAMPPELRAGIKITSAYRSPQEQSKLFSDKMSELIKAGNSPEEAAQMARKWVAPPGRSNHNHGEALDLGFGSKAAQKWIHDHAGEYGLYFPMGHEPWHIERINGPRKGGAAPSATTESDPIRLDVHPKTDGPGEGDSYSSRADQFVWRFRDNGQNPNSTASGPGDYLDSTWLDHAKQFAPEKYAGKTDAQILADKNNPDAVKAVLTGAYKHYGESLTKNGLDDNSVNATLLHWFGEGGGMKVARAKDNTRIEDLISADAVRANNLQGKTVAQVKQTVADWMGVGTDANARARNAIRGVDQQFAGTTPTALLNNQMRRDRAFKYLSDMATKTLDDSWLERMPAEMMTPEQQADAAALRLTIAKGRLSLAETQRRLEAQKREDDERKMKDDIVTELAKPDGDIDPAKAAVGPDGKVNHSVYDYALEARKKKLSLSEPQSYNNALNLEEDIARSAATGDWKKMFPDLVDGQQPSDRQIRDVILSHKELLPEHQKALLSSVEKTRQAYSELNGTEKETYWSHYVKPDLDLAAQDMLTKKLAPTLEININKRAREAFDFDLQQSWKEALKATGAPPVNRREAYEHAVQAAQKAIQLEKQRILKGESNVGKDTTTKFPTRIDAGNVVGIPGPDGVIRIMPKEAAPPEEAPAAEASKPFKQPEHPHTPTQFEKSHIGKWLEWGREATGMGRTIPREYTP